MRHITALASVALLGLAAATGQPAKADEVFSIVIDPFTGAAELRNDSPAAVELNGYLLQSPPNPVLDVNAWSSLADQGEASFAEAPAIGGRQIGEISLFGSVAIEGGQSRSIGNPYEPFSPSDFGEQPPGLQTLDFTYSLLGQDKALTGDVEFSARNSVVLVVDPGTGAASLVNQSNFDIDLDSYLITSTKDVLDGSSWAPLATGDTAWTASPGVSNRLFEGNLFGSSFLAANGGSLPLGAPIDPSLLDDETDLALEFTVLGSQTIDGGVQFSPSFVVPALDGDFNGDGVVNLADYTVWRDQLGAADEAGINNNGDGVPGVGPGDYALWKANFGALASVGGAAQVLLASNAVPEPATGLGALSLIASAAVLRRKVCPAG